MLECNICGKFFHHLGSHIWHRHKITARAYKLEYGLPFNMALITDDIHNKLVDGYKADICLKNIRGEQSKQYQFKPGRPGVRRISEHERVRIIDRIKAVNESHQDIKPCPVCKQNVYHLESHLYNAHRLIGV